MSAIHINESEFNEKVKNTNKKVLVDCFAEWCGPCKMMSPIIDELADEMTTCDIYKLNIEEAENVAEEFDIMSIPTILIFENGELKTKVSGFRSKEDIVKLIEG